MDGISIIICTYNGKTKLEKTLSAIKHLQSICPWELIIVDNASTDGCDEYATSLLKESFLDWQICYESKPGLMNARLCGLNVAKYDILLYCDDDNALQNDYLVIGYELLNKNNSIGAIGGCGFPVFEAEKPSWFDKYSHSFAVGPQAGKDGHINNYPAEVYGAGTFFRKKVLLKFLDKGFKSGLSGRTGSNLVSGEDVEWCFLIQLLGYEIWYDHRLKFQHEMPSDRMNWEYYLRLKKGIAKGTIRLLPYGCLLKNAKSSKLMFLFFLLKHMFKIHLVYLKHSFFKKLKSNELSKEEKLIQVIWEAKVNSFWKDCISTWNHFNHLKKMIKS